MRDLTNEGKKGITPIVRGGVLPCTDTDGSSGKTLNPPNLRPNLACLGTCNRGRPICDKGLQLLLYQKETDVQFWASVIKLSELQIQIGSPK